MEEYNSHSQIGIREEEKEGNGLDTRGDTRSRACRFARVCVRAESTSHQELLEEGRRSCSQNRDRDAMSVPALSVRFSLSPSLLLDTSPSFESIFQVSWILRWNSFVFGVDLPLLSSPLSLSLFRDSYFSRRGVDFWRGTLVGRVHSVIRTRRLVSMEYLSKP